MADLLSDDGLVGDLLLDDEQVAARRFYEQARAESERYQALLAAKRKAGKLIEAGSPLAAKAVLVLAELEAAEAALAGSLSERARGVLAELPSL